MPRLNRMLSLVLGVPLLLSACATPPDAQDNALAKSMETDVRPESAATREEIGRQDILTQATFWAKEYDKNPMDLEAATKLARLVRKMGNPGRAAAIGNQALALHPDNRDLLVITGQSLIEQGRPEQAISYLQTALKQNPSDTTALSALGVALDQTGKHKEAMANFNRAYSLKPNDPNIMSNIGISHAMQGDAATAETWLRMALKQPAAGPQVRQNLALVLALQGKFGEAEAMASKDLPPAMAEKNIEYVKSLVTRPNAWNQLRDQSDQK